jgi:hypothetical protein
MLPRPGSWAWNDAAAEMTRITRFLLALGALATPMKAAEANSSGIVNFLDVIGGSTELSTIDRDRTDDPLTRPLRSHAGSIAGYRFFREVRPRVGSGIALSARDAFYADCQALGGSIEPEDSPVHRRFVQQFLGKLPTTMGSHRYVGHAAVCSAATGETLGGFTALVFDTSHVARGDPLGEILMRTLPVPTKTAVYAWKPGVIFSRANLERNLRQDEARRREEAANRQLRAREDEARQAAFRETIKVGSQTNCGMVIEIRGDIVQVQTPNNIRAAGGERNVWVRRDQLRDDRSACVYG